MYGQWQANPDSVDRSWWPILEKYALAQQGTAPATPKFDEGEPTTGSLKIIDTDSTVIQNFDANSPAPPTEAITIPVAKTTEDAPKNAPVPADLPPVTGSMPVAAAEVEEENEVTILRGMAKTLSTELLPRGIRVNAVSPGPVDTPLYDKLGIPDAYREQVNKDIVATIPFGRFGTPEEVAKAVLYLASDESRWTVGSEIIVDGGRSL